jgi:hypothetical protein
MISLPTLVVRLATVAAGTAFLALPANGQKLTKPDTTGCSWRAECSAPGTTLRMVEISRTGRDRGTRIALAPRVGGFPAGVPLTLWMRRIDGVAQWIVTGYSIDDTGAVTCADKARHASLAETAGAGWCPMPLDSVSFSIGEAMQGEAFSFAMSTSDGRQSAFATVVPRPLTASIPGCGALDARVVDAEATAMAITAQGFPPLTSLTTISVSGRETVAGTARTDSAGRFVSVIMPGVRGSRGGEASYTVSTGSCEVKITYPWGRAAR